MSSAVPVDATPLEDPQQCEAFLLQRAKPASEWVIGTEHEKLGWSTLEGGYARYEGPHGIGALLEDLAATGRWEVLREGPDIVALVRDSTSITLEPGGQLELSGAPLRRLDETAAELRHHLAEVREFSARHGLIWGGVGLAPTGAPADMPRMPKARYDIMRRYLPTRGRLALHMMHQTCTVQANYDFSDADDALQKLRAALHLQPFVLAAFANSSVVEGVATEHATYRGMIWEHVDSHRTRFPEALLREGASLADYVEWALDVPLFFIHREGAYLDCAGLPFRRFMERGLEGERATVGDFALHLSTLFPDARLKQYLEVRGADMADVDHVLALPALHAGLLYDERSLAATLALFDGVGLEEHRALRAAACRQGLRARVGGVEWTEMGVELLRLAREGLDRWQPGASRYLEVLEDDVPAGRAPADALRAAWRGDAGALIAHTRIA